MYNMLFSAGMCEFIRDRAKVPSLRTYVQNNNPMAMDPICQFDLFPVKSINRSTRIQQLIIS